MKIRATLTAINSESDINGNRYWAFEYLDHETGKTVKATISGGESNIYGILRHMYADDDWDRSIIFRREEMKKRAFNQRIREWEYSACRPEDLAKYIKDKLAESPDLDTENKDENKFE